MSLSELSSWNKIRNYALSNKSKKLLDYFSNDKDRFNNFSIECDDLIFDYSKNFIDNELMQLFLNLADEIALKEKIEDMFSGMKINTTENRAVLHTALRDFATKEIILDGENIIPKIEKVRLQMKDFVSRVHSGKFLGYSSKKITNIVNIGIGGSDLGPAMVCKALAAYKIKDINIYFVSNIDPTDITDVLAKLSPENTLFIIASKTFTTQETIRNAETAKEWFLKNSGNNHSNIAKHFIALSTNKDAVTNFGISEENMFEFWDWVGGRYSLWSAIGISIALYVGYDNFEKLLLGANEIDNHFRKMPFEKNIPFIMAMLSTYYNNFMNAASYAVIPYDHYLIRFPAFLQQLDMESNGKSITKSNDKVDYNTGAIIWGEPGTNAQHSFFQLIHQGTQMIPLDFIAGVNSLNPIENHHEMLLSNYFAQTEALMNGKNEQIVQDELIKTNKTQEEIQMLLPHKVFPGSKPSNSILYKKLTPKVLGKLIVLYEHKVFVQGVIWNVNSFDQWGVELGKQLAIRILPELMNNEEINSHDDSTNGLINYYKKWKNKS